MKKVAWIIGLLISVSAFAQTDETTCLKLLEVAEHKEGHAIYDECLYKDKELAWTKWAPLLSQHQYKKAMFELSQRYPDHEYANLYCKKSADLGYIPAMYEQAEQKFKQGKASEAVRLLEKIVKENPWPATKFVVDTQTDKAILKAYTALGISYLTGNGVGRYINSAINFLSISAKLDDPVASNALGIALLERGYPSDKEDGERALWKASLKGCPAAEENLFILSLLKAQKIEEDFAKKELAKRTSSCRPPSVEEGKPIKKRDDCDCVEVLAWEKLNRNKPYTLISTHDDRAVLEDREGKRSTVYLNKHAGEYIVSEIRPTAVILKRKGERIVLLLREDRDCVPLCHEADKPLTTDVLDKIPPFSFSFTENECNTLVQYIESLNQPNLENDIRGFRECWMRDWDRWGEKAKARKSNKHLYLLKNYQESKYLPSYVALAEYFAEKGDEASMEEASKLLVTAIKLSPIDALSAKERERAFCVKAKMHLSEGPHPEEETAVVWAATGAKEDFPQSLNLLGVLYARGEGVEQNLQRAMEFFHRADEVSVYPFVEAKYNEYLIKTGGDLKNLKLGNCSDILNPPKPVARSFAKYYQ